MFANAIENKYWSTITNRFKYARERIPLTRLGASVALVAGLGLWYFGFKQHDLVWYVGALSGLALIVLATLSVVLGSIFIHKSMQHASGETTGECTTEIPWTSEFVLPNIRSFPLLDVQLKWAVPRGSLVEIIREDEEARERIILAEHGDIDRVERHFTVTDVLGLAALTLRCNSQARLAVLPNRGALARVPWLASLNGGEDLPHPLGAASGDRLELRRYHAGDPARFIHWKAFARTRKLMQREPERSLSRTHRTAAYLVAGPGDGASAAAALAVLDASALGIDWVFGADGMPQQLESRKEVEAAIRHSAAQRANGGEGLKTFIGSLDQGEAFNLMLFVPSVAGEWESHVLSVLARSNIECKVVIGIDGFNQTRRSTAWHKRVLRLALRSEPIKNVDVQALNQLAARIETTGASVLLVDRSSGRLLNRHHLGLETGSKSVAKSVAASPVRSKLARELT